MCAPVCVCERQRGDPDCEAADVKNPGNGPSGIKSRKKKKSPCPHLAAHLLRVQLLLVVRQGRRQLLLERPQLLQRRVDALLAPFPVLQTTTRARPRCENWSIKSKRAHAASGSFFVLVDVAINSLRRNSSSSSSSMRTLQSKQSNIHISSEGAKDCLEFHTQHCLAVNFATPEPMSDKKNKK